jgi:hypothetical protein
MGLAKHRVVWQGQSASTPTGSRHLSRSPKSHADVGLFPQVVPSRPSASSAALFRSTELSLRDLRIQIPGRKELRRLRLIALTESIPIRLFNDLTDRGDCLNTRKSCKASEFVGWVVGWRLRPGHFLGLAIFAI